MNNNHFTMASVVQSLLVTASQAADWSGTSAGLRYAASSPRQG